MLSWWYTVGFKSQRPQVNMLIFCICYECNVVFLELWKMSTHFRISYYLLCPPFAFPGHISPVFPPGLWECFTQCYLLSILMTHVIPGWFNCVPQSFLCCHQVLGFLLLKYPPNIQDSMFNGVEVRWGKTPRSSSSWKALRCVWGSSSSQRYKLEGIICLNDGRVESILCRYPNSRAGKTPPDFNIPTTMFP